MPVILVCNMCGDHNAVPTCLQCDKRHGVNLEKLARRNLLREICAWLEEPEENGDDAWNYAEEFAKRIRSRFSKETA